MEIRPATTALRAIPGIDAVKLGTTPFPDLLAQQVQFGFAGDGPMSTRTIVPQTEAARRLLIGASGIRTRQALHGLLAEIDGKEGVSDLHGLTLSTDADGYGLNLYESHLEAGYFEPVAQIKTAKQVQDGLTGIKSLADMSVAATHGGYLDVGPDASGTLLSLLRGGEDPGPKAGGMLDAKGVVSLLLHEIQHSVTPPSKNQIEGKSSGRSMWIERSDC